MYYDDFLGEFYKDKNLIDIGSGDYMYYTESGRPVIVTTGNSGVGETCIVYYSVSPGMADSYLK